MAALGKNKAVYMQFLTLFVSHNKVLLTETQEILVGWLCVSTQLVNNVETQDFEKTDEILP